MKINVEIDCTPQEARTFLGLPDVEPMQKAMMAEVEQRMKAGLDSLGPEALFKTWLPAGFDNLEQMQKMFFSQMGQKMGQNKED